MIKLTGVFCNFSNALEKSEGKRKLGSHRHRWGNHIERDFKELRYEDLEWIQLAVDSIQ